MTSAILVSALLVAALAAAVSGQMRAPATGGVAGPIAIIPLPAGTSAMPVSAFDSARLEAAGAQGAKQQRPILTGKTVYNFKKDFAQKINPRLDGSDWKFSEVEDYVGDGGTFLVDQQESVDMVSLPFHIAERYTSGTGRLAGLSGREASLLYKQNLTVPEGQTITARLVFSCKIFNVDQHPFPKEAVTNPIDDPTLASCGLTLVGGNPAGLDFSIVATDKGIWAVYERCRYHLATEPLGNDKSFTVFHHLAERRTPYEPIDAGVQYDKISGRVSYLLNNKVSWTLDNIGKLPTGDPWTSVYTQDRADLQNTVVPEKWMVAVGLTSWLDVNDPFNPASSEAKVRLVKDPAYYDDKIKFWDNEGKLENKEWGQGASMTLYDLAIDMSVGGNRAPRGWGPARK